MKVVNSITVRKLINVDNHSITLPENSEHLVLVGFNGTGKSSILRALACGDNSAVEIDMTTSDAHVVVWDRGTVWSDGQIIPQGLAYYSNVIGWGELCDNTRVVQRI